MNDIQFRPFNDHDYESYGGVVDIEAVIAYISDVNLDGKPAKEICIIVDEEGINLDICDAEDNIHDFQLEVRPRTLAKFIVNNLDLKALTIEGLQVLGFIYTLA